MKQLRRWREIKIGNLGREYLELRNSLDVEAPILFVVFRVKAQLFCLSLASQLLFFFFFFNLFRALFLRTAQHWQEAGQETRAVTFSRRPQVWLEGCICQTSAKHGWKAHRLFFNIYSNVCVPDALSHLSDLLAHQREQPDIKQQLPRRGQVLEVDHQHHREQEEEGEVRHDVPVKLDLRRAVQAHQFGPAPQRLQAPQAGEVTVDRKVAVVREDVIVHV